MCAIHGILSNQPEQIDKMIQAAHHRGPDGNGKWNDEDLTLGHNLLSIVDEEVNSKQPWHLNNLVLVFNGEIYNHLELRKTLSHKFQTNTDTETLIAGINEKGIDFIKKLDGMFAFACYDKTKKHLTIARDSNGTKPVYFGYKNNTFCFSSEIKSLLSIDFQRKICKEGLRHYYKQGYNSGYLTLFEGIQKLVPGEVVTINVRTNDKTTFNLNNVPIGLEYSKQTHEYADELRDKLHQAVKMTLMGRRKIGLFLSGGLDSTSILYEMTQLGVVPNTFTSYFSDLFRTSKLNEDSLVAKQFANELNVSNERLWQNEEDFINAIDNTFYALEEPRQGKSFPTYYNTNKFMSENGITVTLSGDGGDELLFGYKHQTKKDWKLKLQQLSANHRELQDKEMSLTIDEQMNYLNEWLPKEPLTGDKINDMMYIESLNTLCDDFLIRNDKLGMNFSMEARFPMMCNVFRDFCRKLPSNLKGTFLEMPNKKTRVEFKTLFKMAYKNRLPNSILSKQKTGWRFPTDELLIGSEANPGRDESKLRAYIFETLKDKEVRDIFELDDNIVKGFLDNKNLKPAIGSKWPPALLKQKELFTIFNFAIWKKVFKMTV